MLDLRDRTTDKENLIHKASMEILKNVGIKFHNEKAVEILTANGIAVEDNVAKFTEEEVMRWVRKAPAHFTLYAENPKYDMEFGGDIVNFAPGYGCAFVADRDGEQRVGTLADYIKCVKLYEANDDFDVNGGILIQPSDVPQDSAPIDMFYATFTHSEKCIMLSSGNGTYIRAILEALAAVYGGKEGLIKKPRVILNINTNAPLGLDEVMLDDIMAMAEYGQPVIIATSTMLGMTGPVTIAGTMAASNAEVMAGIALTQMIRPGTPVLYGQQHHATDMKSGQIAGASPEAAILHAWGSRMAKFYRLPCRGGGAICDAPRMTPQAGYESMMTLFSSCLHGSNYILHSAGIISSFNAIQFEKMIMDFEIVRYVKRYFEGFEINERTLALDLTAKIGHEGEFLTAAHTLKNFRKEMIVPHIGTRGNIKNPIGDFDRKIEERMQTMLELYDKKAPKKDAICLDRIKDILVAAGIDQQQLERIENL